ncbi:MAG: cysteine hydrolase family protein [Victivallaceae bacterium]|nr:isochorismatase family cysteine hydrolase [Victivallaceae bacterium]
MTIPKSALIVIDMQKDGMNMLPPAREVIPAVARLIAACRKHGVHIIYKSRVHRANGVDVETFRRELFARNPFLVEGSAGAEIIDELSPRPEDIQVRGTRFSGFFQTDLQLILTRLGIERLLICGVQTPNCIRATVTDAIAYDYQVVLASDAITAKTPEVHAANLADMENMGVTISTTDEIIDALVGCPLSAVE